MEIVTHIISIQKYLFAVLFIFVTRLKSTSMPIGKQLVRL